MRIARAAVFCLAGPWLAAAAIAHDFGTQHVPISKGRLGSAVFYEWSKIADDFDTRGSVEERAQVVGTRFSYAWDDRWALAVKGGVLVDPRLDAQGDRWSGRGGYVYGLDAFHDVFPATRWRAGLKIGAGVSAYRMALDRQAAAGTAVLIDERLSAVDYHGSAVASLRWPWGEPYAGLRVYGRSVDWRNNRPAADSPARISGHSDGNVSIVLGCPIRLGGRFGAVIEGTLLNETKLTAGLTALSF